MNDKAQSLAKTLSVMCVMGWFADTVVHIRHGSGWVLPGIITITAAVLAFRLRQELNRA